MNFVVSHADPHARHGRTLVIAPKKKERRPPPGKPKTLLQQLAAKPDKLFTGAFKQQYGALCFRHGAHGIEVLVMTSRESGRWVIPKGWPMKKKKPYEAAATEAWEEASVRGTVGKKPIGRYTYLKWLDNGDVAPCIVDVYPVHVLEQAENFKERGQRTLAWVEPDEAARRVREIELKSLLVDFKAR